MNQLVFSSVLLLLLVLLKIGDVSADDPRRSTRLFTSGDHEVALVELFTSEGCSSCPPAERWLGSLAGEPGLWADFVPVAFHVDYWDYIGWPDRFASADYSARQRRYASEGNLRTVYTPGVVKGGEEWRGWFRNPVPETSRKTAGALSVAVTGKRVAAAYRLRDDRPPDSVKSAPAELTLNIALLGMDLQTRVRAGENRGRTLSHDFVVLGVNSSALSASGGRYATELTLPRASAAAPRYALAAWVSAGGRQAPVQATGGYLDGILPESIAAPAELSR